MNRENIPNSLIFIILFSILSLGLLVRLYKIDSPIADWHSWRQVDTASVTRIYQKEGLDLLKPRYFDISMVQTGYPNPEGLRYVEFPIFNLIHYYVLSLTPLSIEISGRLISIFFALITSLSLFVIGNKLKGRVVGLLSAATYLLLPYNIFFTRVILPDPMGVSFLTISIAFIVYFLESEKKRYIYLFSIFFSLAMLTKPFAIFFAIPIFYLIYRKYGLKKILSKPVYSAVLFISLAPFIAWRGYMNYGERFVGTPHSSWMFNGDGIRFRPAFWYWIFGERIGNLIMGVWGVPMLMLGALTLNKKTRSLAIFLVGSLLYLFTIATANVRHDYYQIYIIPSVSILFAFGVSWFWENISDKKVLLVSFMISIASMFVVGWYNVRDFYKVNRPQMVTAGQAIQKLTNPDDKVIAPYNGDTAFLYHTDRFGWPIVELPIGELVDLGADYYVSLDFNEDAARYASMYETVEKTSDYIILNLNKKI